MKKNKKNNAIEMPLTDGTAALAPQSTETEIDLTKEEKVKTDKKILKQAEKLVRRADNVLSKMNELALDAQDLEQDVLNSAAETPIAKRDEARITEMSILFRSLTNQLYHITARMARKYADKKIDDLGPKRKALKD